MGEDSGEEEGEDVGTRWDGEDGLEGSTMWLRLRAFAGSPDEVCGTGDRVPGRVDLFDGRPHGRRVRQEATVCAVMHRRPLCLVLVLDKRFDAFDGSDLCIGRGSSPT